MSVCQTAHEWPVIHLGLSPGREKLGKCKLLVLFWSLQNRDENTWLGPCHPAGVLQTGGWSCSVECITQAPPPALGLRRSRYCFGNSQSLVEQRAAARDKKPLFVTGLGQFPSLLFSALERGVRVTELWVPRWDLAPYNRHWWTDLQAERLVMYPSPQSFSSFNQR